MDSIYLKQERMQGDSLEGKFHSQQQEEEPYRKPSAEMEAYLNRPTDTPKRPFLDPPRQLPKRSYSLEPDMVGGWKPKGKCKIMINNVFSIRYEQQVVDDIVKELYKHKAKHKEKLVYLGPRRNNSYILHEGRQYDNPYPFSKKQEQMMSSRNNVPLNPVLQECSLTFNSDFESGNLDAAVSRSEGEFDLFMRVDSNTRGHTNWFYFEVGNGEFIGTVRLNICNFRREKSLYQRGLRPYTHSKLDGQPWHQGGNNVRYERVRPRYGFLYEDWEEEAILNTLFAMSFEFDFMTPHDTTSFAYCIPYTYSQLTTSLATLGPNCKQLGGLKTLTGLSIPVLQITNEEEPEYNKKVVLVAGRIHPGESNSSHVAEGLLEYLCSNEQSARQARKMYIFYVIPMINPDGVVAGNYRTSLFGKDLNRTFHQSRKYAFPETYQLLQTATELKARHKKRFCLFIDLHGHSVRKNIFMYGPEFGIQHGMYEKSRDLPKMLGNLTCLFRYYSCIFRISSEKATTGRAVLNRKVDIPFTYTMESSNGFYYDPQTRTDEPFTAAKWKEMGKHLVIALSVIRWDEKKRNSLHTKHPLSSFLKQEVEQQAQQHNSDDDISEGDSDSEPSNEDLGDKELMQIEEKIAGKAELLLDRVEERPSVEMMSRASNKDLLSQTGLKKQRPGHFLPPINTLNRAQIFSNRHQKKQSFKQERLKLIESQVEFINDKPSRTRAARSQLEPEHREEARGTGGGNVRRSQGRREWFSKFRSPK